MSELAAFQSVIELWPSKEAMASDVGANPWAVSKWWQRNSIPSEWWASVLATDKAREKGVTAELLTTLAAREPLEAQS